MNDTIDLLVKSNKFAKEILKKLEPVPEEIRPQMIYQTLVMLSRMDQLPMSTFETMANLMYKDLVNVSLDGIDWSKVQL